MGHVRGHGGRLSGWRRLAVGYGTAVTLLGVAAVPLSGGYAVFVAGPILVVGSLALVSAVTGAAAPRAGAALLMLLLVTVAAVFVAADVAYSPDDVVERSGFLRDLGSALEDNVSRYAPPAIAALHGLLCALVAVLASSGDARGARRR